MKTKLLAFTAFSATLCYGQVQIDNSVFISESANFYSNMAVNITTNGTLHIAGSFFTNADITGDNKISYAGTASVDLNNATLTLSNQSNVSLYSLTIGNAGVVEVPAGNSLTLLREFYNYNTSGGIKLFATSAGYAQLLPLAFPKFSYPGIVYAEQYLTAATKPGWRQLASPVATTLADVEDDFTVKYSAAPASEQNAFWWDASPQTSPSTLAKGWTNFTANTDAFMQGANPQALNLFTGGTTPILNNGILAVTGEVGNYDFEFNIYATQATVQQTLENTGWNLIPNPYPSNINVSKLISNSSDFPLAYKAVHVWNASAQQYVAITGDVSIVFNPKVDTANHNIAPFQAFWVKGSSTPSSSAQAGEYIRITNSHRTVTANYNVFKTAPDLIRINAIAENGEVDQTIITFESEAEDGLDDRDAFKIITMNEDMHSLYTFAGGNKIAINRKNMPEPYKHIPMQFTAPTAGEFTIAMVEETVNPGWMIELEDHKTGTIHNMRNGDYAFINDPGFEKTRFTVHINKTGESITSYNAERVYIHANNDGINVVFGFMMEAVSADVLITNLAGQILYNGTVPTDQPFVYPVHTEINMYVVHVVTNGKVTVEKIVR